MAVEGIEARGVVLKPRAQRLEGLVDEALERHRDRRDPRSRRPAPTSRSPRGRRRDTLHEPLAGDRLAELALRAQDLGKDAPALDELDETLRAGRAGLPLALSQAPCLVRSLGQLAGGLLGIGRDAVALQQRELALEVVDGLLGLRPLSPRLLCRRAQRICRLTRILSQRLSRSLVLLGGELGDLPPQLAELRLAGLDALVDASEPRAPRACDLRDRPSRSLLILPLGALGEADGVGDLLRLLRRLRRRIGARPSATGGPVPVQYVVGLAGHQGHPLFR
jgi:hypothetical protein